MVYFVTPGTDDIAHRLPWMWKTIITCPDCSAQWYLTKGDTDTALAAANIGATGTRTLGWQQLSESGAIDAENLNLDPAQVKGECPYCGYWPLTVQGPRYGLAKVTFNTDPAASAIQGYKNGGATSVGFYQTNGGILIGVFFKADNTAYGLDTPGAYCNAVQRTGANTLDATTKYLLHTPGQRISAAQAQALDAGLCALLVRLGLALS